MLRSNLRKKVSYIVVVGIFVLLSINIIHNWEEIRQAQWQISGTLLLLIFIIGCLLHILNAVSWHLMTKALAFKISFGENIRVWMLPNLSRFIPGIVWQYLGRVYLLKTFGISKSWGALAVALDAVFTFSIGALVVGLAVAFFSFPLPVGLNTLILFIIPLPLFIPLMFGNKKAAVFILQLVQKVTKKKYDLTHIAFDAKWLVGLSFTTFLQFIVAGGLLFIIANSLYALPIQLIPLFAAVYAGSWILGYISFFAPGGLGIQELSIAGLLSLFMPFPLASLAALGLRFAITFGELTILAFVFLSSKKLLKTT